jgi:ankyrin repeat protein
MRTLGFGFLLFGTCLWASTAPPASYPSFDYDVVRTHEIKPHRHKIPAEGVSFGFNQLHLNLIVSPSGDVIHAGSEGGKSLDLWPSVRDEALGWKFTPFTKNGKAVTAEIEEYVDLVPPERFPTKHVAPPVLRPDSQITITLTRTACYGTCPSYMVTAGTQGIVFDGRRFVVASGRHTSTVDVEKVRRLAREFIAADFYSMDPAYRVHGYDIPTYAVSIAIDGHEKVVVDYDGQTVGMPSVISDLEDEVDTVADTARWVEGSDGLVQALRQERFDFTSPGAQTMLKAAAQRGKTTTVLALLHAGVPLSEVRTPQANGGGEAVPLQNVGLLTAAADHPDTLRVLIAARASEKNPQDKEAALVGAAQSGNLESAKALIAYGANPKADLNGLMLTQYGTPMTIQFPGSGNVLFYAAQSGRPEMVREILRYHPDVNAPGPQGRTPIFAAGESRYRDKDGARVEIVRLLAAAGARVNVHDRDGNTVLHETFLIHVQEELLRLGADVNARNNKGETPIFTVVNDNAIPLFVEHGADLTIRNNKGETAYEAATVRGPARQEALRVAMENLHPH